MKRLVIFLFCILLLASASATDYYVATDGSDSHPGTISQPFETIQHAIDNMNGGDTIYLREGTYYECPIVIPCSKDGTPDSYSTLMSYPDEWAIIDGQNNCGNKGYVIGHYESDHTANYDLQYWKFERLEIKNGASPDGRYAAGFAGNGGPFIFRNNYIHDNLATTGGNNPAGLRLYHMHDSIIEYNFIENNGIAAGVNDGDGNPGNIVIFSDYNSDDISDNGYDVNSIVRPTARNEIRYNYLLNSNVGFKHKAQQFFSGRNPAEGHGWDDSYSNFGDNVHHNIIKNTRKYAVVGAQDFVQIHHNIIDSANRGININYQPASQIYKAVTYNNLLKDVSGYHFIRFAKDSYSYEPREHYGWDYNNIFDGSTSMNNYCTYDTLTVAPFGGGCSSTQYDLSNYYSTDNYFYKPTHTDLIRLQGNSYSASSFESQSQTHSPRNVYSNQYSSSNQLYQGTSGSAKYKTIQSHVLESSTTIANGGVSISHPYLSGITIPSYVGPCPDDNCGWIDDVLELENLGSGYTPPDPYCDDGTCNGDETCSSCPQDCPTLSGQVCCSGIIYTGDCCSNTDCSENYICTNHVCTFNQSNCTESWTCTDWTTCTDNQQTRTCTDANNCGTTNDKPDETQSCTTGDETILNYNYIEDTYIDINNDINADSEYLNTYTWPENTITNAILMKFDLSTISEEVTNAKLKLYFSNMEGDGGDSNYELTIHRIINKNPVISEANGYDSSSGSSWTPTGEDVPLAQGDITSATETVSISKTFGWHEFDVTTIINYWLNNPSENFGLLINSDSSASEDSNRIFVSTENSNTNQRPELILQFEESTFNTDLDNDGDVDLDDFEILNSEYGTTYSLMDLSLMGKDFEN